MHNNKDKVLYYQFYKRFPKYSKVGSEKKNTCPFLLPFKVYNLHHGSKTVFEFFTGWTEINRKKIT